MSEHALKQSFHYPVKVADIHEHMPHRPPMIWVDEVLRVSEDDGTCRVRLDPMAHYMDKGGIRPSSFVEWMAQSYGYIKTCQVLSGLIRLDQMPKVAFLAQISKTKFHNSIPKEGNLLVTMRLKRQLGPLILVAGEIFEESTNNLLATSDLKLYSE